MIKGILQTLLYYVLMFGAVWLLYINQHGSYAHAPGPHHLLLLLTIAISVIWTMGAVLSYFLSKKSPKLIGVILTHVLVVTVFLTLGHFNVI